MAVTLGVAGMGLINLSSVVGDPDAAVEFIRISAGKVGILFHGELCHKFAERRVMDTFAVK